MVCPQLRVNTKAETTEDDSIVVDNFVSSNSGSTVTAGGSSILSGSVPETWVYGNAYVSGGPNTGAPKPVQTIRQQKHRLSSREASTFPHNHLPIPNTVLVRSST